MKRRGFLKLLAAAGIIKPVAAALPAAAAPSAAAGVVVGPTGAPIVAGAAIRHFSMSWEGLEWFGSYFSEAETARLSPRARRRLELEMVFSDDADVPQCGDVIDLEWMRQRGAFKSKEAELQVQDGMLLDDVKLVVDSVQINAPGPAMPLTARITASEAFEFNQGED